MFNNYQELFQVFAEFYGASSFLDRQNHLLTYAASASDFSKTSTTTNNCSEGSIKGPEISRGIQNLLARVRCLTKNQVTPAIGSKQLDEFGNEITIGSFNKLEALDLAYILVIFSAFVLAKSHLSRKLRSSKKLTELGLETKNRARLDECLWRLLFYGFSSTWLVYSCFFKRDAQLLFNPNRIFTSYSFRVDLDEYLICMIEVAFYLHATYAILAEDVWRRDSPMMLVHHVAAIFSVYSLYATRIHRVGLVAVVLRDTCDVLLEVTKLAMCLRVQHGRIVKRLEYLVKISMSIFTLSFVINQLYYYPLFCLYHGFNIIKVYNLQSPIMTGILTCGLIFLVLDLFWFMLILRLLYRMLLYKGPLEDLREYDEECDFNQTKVIQKKED